MYIYIYIYIPIQPILGINIQVKKKVVELVDGYWLKNKHLVGKKDKFISYYYKNKDKFNENTQVNKNKRKQEEGKEEAHSKIGVIIRAIIIVTIISHKI